MPAHHSTLWNDILLPSSVLVLAIRSAIAFGILNLCTAQLLQTLEEKLEQVMTELKCLALSAQPAVPSKKQVAIHSCHPVLELCLISPALCAMLQL